ncbi:MAG: YtxH domain-containing protein [Deltaproteobacteria bacterium]|nr:YtxH domain-containing protein [Deltaproteobacteria bacterium]MBW1937536.1 YtxH domain-containing protein [Deltaproteobacteria bacterium]MBW1964112.1 YtxH domain-containing protein [Deltaproteobacteria bacterium]
MSNSEGRYSAGCVAIAFLLGGAVGAGLATLLTPKTGSEVRSRIREQAYAVRGEAHRVADDVRDKAGDLLDKSKGVIEQKKAVLESAYEAGKEAMSREKERLVARMKSEKAEDTSSEKEET